MLLEPMLHIRGYSAVIRAIAALKQIDTVFFTGAHIENFGPNILRFAKPLRAIKKTMHHRATESEENKILFMFR
ncbi:MAG: hypothetical protein JW832_17765 [Deltaproteobacteria bacterium]|nr:hypothetical protein [Deltaproteobacteria bacterium]